MRRLTSRKTLFINATPDVVWAIHTDIARWSQWQRVMSAIPPAAPLGVGSTFRWMNSGLSIISTIRIWEPAHRTTWTGCALGTRADHSWLLQPWETGTLVTTETSIGGWRVHLMRMFKPLFLDQSLDDWLIGLKSASESAAR